MFEKVIIPYEVYEEFSRVIILKKRIDDLHYEGFLEIRDFDVESESYSLFLKLCDGEFTGRKIGDGEAAAITLAVLVLSPILPQQFDVGNYPIMCMLILRLAFLAKKNEKN